jgi:serpin B
MLIILPNTRTGLSALEKNLNTIDLGKISEDLSFREVHVLIPKFRIEFDIEMSGVLTKVSLPLQQKGTALNLYLILIQQMGMSQMFTEKANFSELLEQNEPLKVSRVVHKAFIEVNEEGAEAAAATGFALTLKSRKVPIMFRANCPFIFALKTSKLIFFIGRLMQTSLKFP